MPERTVHFLKRVSLSVLKFMDQNDGILFARAKLITFS